MLTFAEKERACEQAFVENGPFWHLYTDGTMMGDIFCSEEDFKLGMTLLAVCAAVYPQIDLITFELMSNHVHLVMRGESEDCLVFFEIYKKNRIISKAKKLKIYQFFNIGIQK